MGSQRLRITNIILKEKNKVGRLILSNLKTYYKSKQISQCGIDVIIDKKINVTTEKP
jgi:hypothetical protein